MAPCYERIDELTKRCEKLINLRIKEKSQKKVAIVIFGFPPNAGAAGTAAYLNVFQSLYRTMHQMKSDGYTIDMPSSADKLREEILDGNSSKFGQEANVAARVDANWIINNTPWLEEIENQWGSAPVEPNPIGFLFLLTKVYCLSLIHISEPTRPY